MEDIYVFMFMVSGLGAIYMLQHGLKHSRIVETLTGTGFALISLAVFFGFNMHISTMNFIRLWIG